MLKFINLCYYIFMIKLKFLGACGSVTGSKYLLTVNDKNYLIDCGLFQGDQEIKRNNWMEYPKDFIESIDSVILTHSHIDHSGFLPRFYKLGFRGQVYATSGTKALLHILLPDSGQLQEEEARYAQKKGYTKFDPPLPLFTEKDAKESLKLLKSYHFYEDIKLNSNTSFSFNYAGHILGASYLLFNISIDNKNSLRILFSGDLGRNRHPIIKNPDPFKETDFLIIESTYADKIHREENISDILTKIINETYNKNGTVLIPAFAVDRTQEIQIYLADLIEKELIPKDINIYIDSPMAMEASNLYKQFSSEYNEEFKLKVKEKNPFRLPNFQSVKSIEESKALNNLREPSIIISASGMCNGGRIEHHLKHKLEDPKNTIFFVGFQAAGTKGRKILDGEKIINIHGEEIKVNARVEKINALSSHADYDELLWWLKNSEKILNKIFITHGEDQARENLRVRLKKWLDVETCVPKLGEEFILYD